MKGLIGTEEQHLCMFYFPFSIKSISEPGDAFIDQNTAKKTGFLSASVCRIYRLTADDQHRGARWLKGSHHACAPKTWVLTLVMCGFCFRSTQSMRISVYEEWHALICHAQWTPFSNREEKNPFLVSRKAIRCNCVVCNVSCTQGKDLSGL